MDGAAVGKNLVRIAMVMDCDGMVLSIEFVAKCYSLFLEPGVRLATVEDDSILEAAKADVQ